MARIVWAAAPVEMGRWVAAVVGHVGTGTTKADEEGGLDSAQKGDWETNLETNMEEVTFGAGTSKERWVVCCAVLCCRSSCSYTSTKSAYSPVLYVEQ